MSTFVHLICNHMLCYKLENNTRTFFCQKSNRPTKANIIHILTCAHTHVYMFAYFLNICTYFKLSADLQRWRSQLRDEYKRSLEQYVKKTTEEKSSPFHNLNDIYVELRMIERSNEFTRAAERRNFNSLMPTMDIEKYPKINVTYLFVAEHPEMRVPVSSVVTGSAGVGKTSLCLHIVEQWLKGELLPHDIHHVFLIHLRYLAASNSCSVEDLFFRYQKGVIKPNAEGIGEFFEQLRYEPEKTLLILDGWDEIPTETIEENYFDLHYTEKVDMPRLVISIINRSIIPSVRILVTSRPRSITSAFNFDRKARIYGFTPDKIDDYIVKFSSKDDNLKTHIREYIDANVNIKSICSIPSHLNMICRIVKDMIGLKNNPDLPQTLTELFVHVVGNILRNRHPDFKLRQVSKRVNVIGILKEAVLSHARIARYGMEHKPIKITFTEDDVDNFRLTNVATKCGLMTGSEETPNAAYVSTDYAVFSFQHLTLQEFLAAVELLSEIKHVEDMTSRPSDGQLDFMLVFMAGLLGNNRTAPFLDSLQLTPTVQLDDLVKLVVSMEQRNEANITDELDRSSAHKYSTLFLVMLLYESRQLDMWLHMSEYILENSTVLDLSDYIISRTELRALVYVLPKTRVTSLM